MANLLGNGFKWDCSVSFALNLPLSGLPALPSLSMLPIFFLKDFLNGLNLGPQLYLQHKSFGFRVRLSWIAADTASTSLKETRAAQISKFGLQNESGRNSYPFFVSIEFPNFCLPKTIEARAGVEASQKLIFL